MSNKFSRFGWLDAMLCFSLWVLVLKAFHVLVCVSAIKEMIHRMSSLTLLGDEFAIPDADVFARWVADASANNPFLSYVERLALIVLCLAFLCMILAIVNYFRKRKRCNADEKAGA